MINDPFHSPLPFQIRSSSRGSNELRWGIHIQGWRNINQTRRKNSDNIIFNWNCISISLSYFSCCYELWTFTCHMINNGVLSFFLSSPLSFDDTVWSLCVVLVTCLFEGKWEEGIDPRGTGFFCLHSYPSGKSFWWYESRHVFLLTAFHAQNKYSVRRRAEGYPNSITIRKRRRSSSSMIINSRRIIMLPMMTLLILHYDYY